MPDRLAQILDAARQPPAPAGAPKVVPLDAMVRQHVRPGMTLHLGVSHFFPHAITAEVIRAFRGTRPGFEVVCAGLAGLGIAMAHEGLVERVIASYAGDIYPSPAPNKIVQARYADGSVRFEHWSLLSLIQRLAAGALGVPAFPTRSLAGSTMAEDNAAAFRALDDPFGGDDPLQLVAALRPDLTLTHAWAADEDGNCLLTAPWSEGTFGAMAAREGALVTVERIVPREFVRQNSHHVKLPGRYVKAVAVAPFGAHPGGMYPAGLDGFDPYAEDVPFLVDFRRACKTTADLDAWIAAWVTGPGGHDGYLERLGRERLDGLLRRGRADAWEEQLAELGADVDFDAPPTPTEEMVLAAADLLQVRMAQAGLDTILAGQGLSNLAAWIAAGRMRASGTPVTLSAEIGMLGYAPRPANPFLFNFANLPTCEGLSDTLTTLGVLVGGATSRCIGSLGGGQVDRLGNVNSTAVPPLLHLVGSGGANDVASAAAEVVLCVPADPMRLVPRLPYTTFGGERVTALVTTEGVLRKDVGPGELVLTGVFPRGRPVDEAVRAAKARFSWPLQVAGRVAPLPPPDPDELARLRAFDPQRAFLRDRQVD